MKGSPCVVVLLASRMAIPLLRLLLSQTTIQLLLGLYAGFPMAVLLWYWYCCRCHYLLLAMKSFVGAEAEEEALRQTRRQAKRR